MSIPVLHSLLGYRWTATEHDETNNLFDGSIVCIARLIALVGTFVKYLS